MKNKTNSKTTTKSKSWLEENKYIVAIILIFSFLYFSHTGAYKMFMWDEAEYASLAHSLAENGEYSMNYEINGLRPPLYPMLIAFCFKLFGQSYETTKIPGILMSIIVIFSVYYFLSKIYDKRTALISAFLLGIIPFFWKQALYTLTGITFSALNFICLMFFYMGFNKDSKYFYGAFLFFGLSLLTRYNALITIPFIILYAICLFFVDRKKIISVVKNKNTYLSPLVFLVVSLPWAIHEKIHFGDVFYGMKIASMQLPTYNIASFSWYQYLLYLPDILGMSIFILTLFGLYYILVKKDKMGLFLLLNSVMVLAWFSHYAYKEPRLIIQIVPILAIFAGIGLSKVIYSSVRCQLKSKNIALVATGVILIISFYSSYNSVTPYFNQVTAAGYPSLIDATSYAKANSKATEKLIGASGPQYYWYSNRKIVGFAPNESEFSNVQLKDPSIKYILINNHERNQPRYILDFFIDTFFNKTTGQLKHDEDTNNVKIFGDLMHFNDPMNYPTTIVVPRELFDLRNNEQD